MVHVYSRQRRTLVRPRLEISPSNTLESTRDCEISLWKENTEVAGGAEECVTLLSVNILLTTCESNRGYRILTISREFNYDELGVADKGGGTAGP